MRAHTIDTTLGDLIVAVTDEVKPLASNPTNANILVFRILQDLFARKRVRLKKRSKRAL
ncbi:MAG TPA: hypothetical protein VE689_03755 [Candidatus Udaeobacter sp.]|jgi:hypothetical protein|nr:hypothetical protein [Candidatus Udaeobacter sp.]